MRVSAWPRLMPACCWQNSSQVSPISSYERDSRIRLRHCAWAAEHLLETAENACWRPTDAPISNHCLLFSINIAGPHRSMRKRGMHTLKNKDLSGQSRIDRCGEKKAAKKGLNGRTASPE